MKSVILILTILATPFFLAAQDRDTRDLDVPTIIVTGKAEIAVVPDHALISVDFTKTDKDLQIARRMNEEGVARMLDVAKRFSIPQQDVRTNQISVSMKYTSVRDSQKRLYNEDGDEIGTKIFEGYEVSRSVSIKLSDLAKFQELFDEILRTQPTEIDSVSFETTKLRELKDRARDMAMIAAKEKAVAMTKAIGQTVGKAMKITEGTNENRYLSIGGGSANSYVIDTPRPVVVRESLGSFSPGTISIEASVTVVFRLD